MKRKPRAPETHSGIFTEYSEIPTRYRLDTYTSHYEGDDTINRYYTEVLYPKRAPVSESLRDRAERARDSWLDHMEQRNTHHALATPRDVDRWCEYLLEFCNPQTAYKTYFRRIYNFYDYLKTSYRHPHVYNPVLLAANEYDPAYTIWNHRITERPD